MSFLHAPIQPSFKSTLPGEVDTHLRGRNLLLIKIAWVILVTLILGIFVIGLPVYFTQLQSACLSTDACALNGALNPASMQMLHNLGFSTVGYAAYTVTLYVIVSLTWFVLGLLIFLRKSDDWMALFVSFFLVTYNPGTPGGPALALAMVYPAWNLPVKFVGLMVLISLGLFLYLFPDGRFVPRWTRWFILAAIAWIALSNFFPDSAFNSENWPPLLGSAVWLVFVGSLVFAQIYRYRLVSNAAQRRQTRWVVFGGSIAIVGIIALYLSYHLLFPSLSQPGSIYKLVSNTGYPLILLTIPLSVGIAILHSRLWDIDVLINRTLVYSILTGALALVFAGSIILLQFLLRGLIPQTSYVSIAASTLAIRALFQPLRRSIQDFIDRRFYRHKYNAAQAVAAFSETLRDEVDLDQLSQRLAAVVEETVQPTFVSLWLRKPEKEEKYAVKTWTSNTIASYHGQSAD